MARSAARKRPRCFHVWAAVKRLALTFEESDKLMVSTVDLAPLFEPFTLGGFTLRNRFVMPSMQRNFCRDGRLLDGMADYYRQRVAGGVSLVIGEGSLVNHPSALGHSASSILRDDTIDGWQPCIDAVHEEGGRILIQISHPGAMRRASAGWSDAGQPSLSPSGLVAPDEKVGKAATLDELAEIKHAFVETARWAVIAGADGVEFHGCHGFFLDEFLWPETNRRDDRYGGDAAQRVCFPAEVVAAVRAAVPDALISYRLSQWKEVRYDARIAQSPAELKVILDALTSAGVDAFHASARRFFTPEWPASSLGIAGWIKRLAQIPVIAVGSVGLDVDVMQSFTQNRDSRFPGERQLAELVRRFNDDQFDLVAVGRAVIANPDWVQKVRDGRYSEIRAFTKEMLNSLEVTASDARALDYVP